jgi:hypothetical protein
MCWPLHAVSHSQGRSTHQSFALRFQADHQTQGSNPLGFVERLPSDPSHLADSVLFSWHFIIPNLFDSAMSYANLI